MKTKSILLPALLLVSLTTLSGCVEIETAPSYDPYVPFPLTSEEKQASHDKLLTYTNPRKANISRAGVKDKVENSDIVTLNTTYHDVYAKGLYGNNMCPSTGDINLLVIPCNLKGGLSSSQDFDNYRDKIYTAFFGEEDDLVYESVQSFFYKSSFGNLAISGVVTDWFDCTDFFDYQIDENGTVKLLDMAMNWATTVYDDLPWTNFDQDKDGYIDGVVLIYDQYTYDSPYYRRHHLNQNDNLWAYTSWNEKTKPNIEKPTSKAFFWASFDFLNVTKACKGLDTHTYIHETGHLFGLDDYYNYEEPLTVGSSGGSIMQASNIGDHDPYSKMALGWINPLVATGDMKVTLKPFSETGEVLVIHPKAMGYSHWPQDFVSPFDEYFIVDYYTPTGLHEFDSIHGYGGDRSYDPKMCSTSGVRIWHIDARLAKLHEVKGQEGYYSYNIVNTLDRFDKTAKYLPITSNTPTGPHASFDEDFRNYRLLHLLQRGGNNTFENARHHFMADEDLFKTNDVFTLSKYYNLMPTKQATINSTVEYQNKKSAHVAMPFNIKIGEMTNEGVTISVEA